MTEPRTVVADGKESWMYWWNEPRHFKGAREPLRFTARLRAVMAIPFGVAGVLMGAVYDLLTRPRFHRHFGYVPECTCDEASTGHRWSCHIKTEELDRERRLRRWLKSEAMRVVRPVFVDQLDRNEDFWCGTCGEPVLRRLLYCSTRCHNEAKRNHAMWVARGGQITSEAPTP